MARELEPLTKFTEYDLHVHIPAGATPKDGPSGGITLLSSILSVLTGRPINAEYAMTGEINLRGKVMPIGGVKEKLIASRRSGLKTLIFPKENTRDYDELPPYLKKGLKVHFVTHYDEVYKIAFGKKGR